ncbi:hypothetical protein P3T43_006109 [Paraburkholderia sp. GAS41]|uniref:AAA family ATPase n=1 Tax=Paraburkholderia sp. GAS41 TaxID=3035134 RepID=UPI003D217325
MLMQKVRVRNYKCFVDTGEISLAPRFNIFTGRNDAGKSALIEAIGLRQGHLPHRSLTTVPIPTTVPSPESEVTSTYELSEAEVNTLFAKLPQFNIGCPAGGGKQGIQVVQAALTQTNTLVVTWKNGKTEGQLSGLQPLPPIAAGRFATIANVACPHGVALQLSGEFGGTAQGPEVALAIALRDQSYAFRAERLNVGACKVGHTPVLQPNASNLAAVLNVFSSSNRHRYERFMSHVRTIFPHITDITAVPVAGDRIEVNVWTIPPDSERSDLAVPLQESGTGIGQVLAILYVVINSDPSLILIDEPQSFLHPGAIRKLLEILGGYTQHQYVITTHSSSLISMTEMDRLFLVRREPENSASSVVAIDYNSQNDLRMALADVGVRLNDVYGADSILWVEGKTEEVCFPELLQRVAKIPLQGVQILGLVSTDELSSKHTTRVFDIYERLSGTESLLPPSVAFILDREQRSQKAVDDIDRRSNGRVIWLPLRMYENYLLDANNIATVINQEDPTRAAPLSGEAVVAWLQRHAADKRYFSPSDPVPYPGDDWLKLVHGAQVLHDLFSDITEARVEYDKVKHGVMLTQLLAGSPTQPIRGLSTMLGELVANANS